MRLRYILALLLVSGVAQAQLSVKDFGAICNGDAKLTDDTDAIRNAIAAATASGQMLIIPSGSDCVVSSTLTIPASSSGVIKNLHLRGGSRRGSKITFTGTGSLFSLGESMEWFSGKTGAIIENLTLQGPGRETSTIAIASTTDPDATAAYDADATGAAHAVLRGIDIDGFGKGVSGMMQSATIEDNFITRCGTAIKTSRNSLNVLIRRNTIYFVDYGIVSRGDTARIVWNNIENLDSASQGYSVAVGRGYAIQLDGGLDVSVVENHIESSVRGIDVAAGELVSIRNYYGGVETGIQIGANANDTTHRIEGDHFHYGKKSIVMESGAQYATIRSVKLTGSPRPEAPVLVPFSTIDGQEPWRTVGGAGNPGFQGMWAPYYNEYAVPAFAFDQGTKLVRLRGALAGGASGTVAFTLPPGYRPSAKLVLAGVDGSAGSPAVARVDVGSDGTVTIRSAGNLFVALDGITFRAEQ